MHIKLYIHNKPLFLTTHLDASTVPLSHHDDAVLMDELSTKSIHAMLHELERTEVHAGIFIHENLEELKHQFWKQYIIIQAAGGWVVNPKGEVLFMERRGKWDLPKGKLDEGETLEQCAIREVQEETGLQDLTLEDLITVTYHTYMENGHKILKESYWYRMQSNGKENLVPQIEEDITTVSWVSPNDLGKILSNTYQSIADVIAIANV